MVKSGDRGVGGVAELCMGVSWVKTLMVYSGVVFVDVGVDNDDDDDGDTVYDSSRVTGTVPSLAFTKGGKGSGLLTRDLVVVENWLDGSDQDDDDTVSRW